METISVEEADGCLKSIIKNANDQQKQYRVTSSEGAIILLPEETYHNLLVTLELLSTPGLMDSFSEEYLQERGATLGCMANKE